MTIKKWMLPWKKEHKIDEVQAAYFSKLSEEMTKLAASLESPFLSGVKKSVVDKYSDQAHFIYELLQNADDARATWARLELFEDRVIFGHNGSKRFTVTDLDTTTEDQKNGTLGDINSIVSIGLSSKTDKATIGKFGVGFKAVFQYTATPHIYDPEVFFKIERFLVPSLLESDYPGRRKEETLFVFPFDPEKRSLQETYDDISEKLLTLDYPILFLQNLKKIECRFSGTTVSYEKNIEGIRHFEDVTADLITLQNKYRGEDHKTSKDALWRFSRKNEEGQTYSVGFFLDDDHRLIPKKHSAFCFFSTKETTGLNFIVHAPFLLTDSREGIRAGVRHNEDMISLLADLAADALPCLREIGLQKGVQLIDDNILDILPCDEEEFSEIGNKKTISFKPFYYAIKEALTREAIIPTSDGYTTSRDAYWGGEDNSQLARVFSNSQLADLTKNEDAAWAFTSISSPRYAGKNIKFEYVNSLIKNRVSDVRILDLIDGDFIQSQKIDWLYSLYKYISTDTSRIRSIKTKPIFLDSKGKAVAAFDADGLPILFLPSKEESSFTTINRHLLENEDAFELLNRLCVSKPSLKDEIYNLILPQYEEDVGIDNMPHFKKIFQYYLDCYGSRAEKEALISLVRDCEFLLYSLADDETKYRERGQELYFPSDRLIRWFHPKRDVKFISLDTYLDEVGEERKGPLIEFLKELGVEELPRVISQNLTPEEASKIGVTWPYSTRGQTWAQKHIEGCQELVKSIVGEKNSEQSFHLWSILLEIIEKNGTRIFYGSCEYFYRQPHSQRYEPKELRQLRTLPWLFSKSGNFLSAKDLTIQDFHYGYNLSGEEAAKLLELLQIREKQEVPDEEAETESYEEALDSISSYGEELGLSEEEQRQAFLEFAMRKRSSEDGQDEAPAGKDDDDRRGSSIERGHFEKEEDEDSEDIEVTTAVSPSVKRVIKDIAKRAAYSHGTDNLQTADMPEDEPADEDYYSRAPVDLSSKIEKIKKQAEREVNEVARLEDLKRQALEAETYSYRWFKTLLELESLNSGEHGSGSKEISISFSRVELEPGTTRTLILKHPNRYIPQFMEDLADIPLQLHFEDRSMGKVAVEVVNVKSYTLRAKLRTNAHLEGIDLSRVVEARIDARNPVFLIEELRKAFNELGEEEKFADDFNMRDNLCKNIEFVFGPPGTGKTTFIAEKCILPMIQIDEDCRILVLAPTNKAADVIVRRIIESMGEDRGYLDWLIRFGTTNDSMIEQSGVLRDKSFDIRNLNRSVTVTTIARFPYDYFLPDGSTRLYIKNLKWDIIIFDEASMIPLANIIYPLYRKTPQKFIISGDPFQIEPITAVNEWKNENIYTMVQLKSFTEPATVPHTYHVEQLMTQYRSIPEIGEVFSRFAYGGALKHHRSSESKKPLPVDDFIKLEPVNIIKFPVSKFESIYRPKRLQSKTPYQVYSALFAFEFVKHLSSKIGATIKDETFRIGIIAPYRAQADLIDKLMASALLPGNISVQVGTIHGFQGDECEAIVVVFNPPPSITTHEEMFLNKLNIVNVSISRARDYLFILMPDNHTENVANLKLVKRVETYCKEQSSWSEYLSQDVEEIMFGSRTHLEDNSFSTSHQLVNVYGRPEILYEIRSEDSAVDIQIHGDSK